MTTLYTAGYNAGWTPAQLLAQAETTDALIVDIRLNPTSNRPEWKKHALAKLIGWRYMHLPTLGNKNYANGGPITLAHPNEGLATLRQELRRRPLILLCACPDAATCHRSSVTALLPDVPVTHLDPPVVIAPHTTPILSVRQPWAWLITHGPKDIENRSWRRDYRGPLGIHASVTMVPRDYHDAAAYALARGVTVPAPGDLTFGAIVGLATVMAWVDASPSPWFMGPYGLVLAERRPIEPIPARGMQGLWPYALPKGLLE